MSTEENKAIFRRYIEEISNQGNLELADEIFDRYISHEPDGSVLEGSAEDVMGLTRFYGPIRVKRSGSMKGVEDGQDRQAVSA